MDTYKCKKCGYEIEIWNLATLNAATHHFSFCENYEYEEHLFRLRKLKGEKLSDFEHDLAHDLFFGN